MKFFLIGLAVAGGIALGVVAFAAAHAQGPKQ